MVAPPSKSVTGSLGRRPALPRAEGPAALERYVIPNLRNACRILKLLAERPDGLKASELSRSLAIPVTTTLRIMATLQIAGYARKVENRFALGPVLIHLGAASLAGTEIRAAAIPILQALTARTEETSHLAVPCDDRALIVAVQDGPHPLRAASRPGFLAPLDCSSTGKTFLAFMDHDRVEEILRQIQAVRRPIRTGNAVAGIRREAERTRRRGFGLDDEEFAPGVRCLAAPVFSADHACIAAIGVTAAAVRFPRGRIPEMAAAVTAAAGELSRQLGCNDPRDGVRPRDR